MNGELYGREVLTVTNEEENKPKNGHTMAMAMWKLYLYL